MSDDMLTPETPVEDEAAEAPSDEAAVESGSVGSPDSVPASRFNGLMARYNADRETAAAELAAARAEIERLKTPKEKKHTVSDDSNALADEVKELRNLVSQMNLGRARDAALAKYPGAAPLADLLVGDSPEAIERVAATIHERLTGSASASGSGESASEENPSGAAASAAAPEAPAAPVLGGAVAVDDEVTAGEAVSDAVAKGDFSAFWAAAERRAHEAQGADLTVG